jgi:hypothetical protein
LFGSVVFFEVIVYRFFVVNNKAEVVQKSVRKVVR